MVDAQSFLDNLENARLAMSVALEHTQENREQFVKNGTGEQVRQAERSICKVRSLAEQLEKEFTILHDLIDKRHRAELESRLIPEPRRTYLLELLNALGPAAEDFIVAGAQAMKFAVAQARATKDVDFLLNVVALRKAPLQLAQVFEKLGYTPVPESRNFQFEKPIPGSSEKMRIEFMAPRNTSERRIFAWRFRTACMRVPARADRLPWPSPICMRLQANSRTEINLPPRFA
jgi:hypothetical protein